MKLSRFLKFDKYLLPFIIIYVLFYIMGVFKFLYLFNEANGYLLYFSFLIGMPLVIVIFLKIIQQICRFIGVDKIVEKVWNKKR